MIHKLPKVCLSCIFHQSITSWRVIVGAYAIHRGECRGTIMHVLRGQPTRDIYKRPRFLFFIKQFELKAIEKNIQKQK